MAKAKNSFFRRSPLLAFAIVLLLETALVFLFVPKATLIKVQREEAQAIQNQLGESAKDYVKKNSDYYFYNAFVRTKILPVSYDFLIGQWGNDDTFNDRGFAKLVEQRLDATWMALNLASHRVMTLLLWFPYIIPFLMGIVIDGLVEREIRKHRFAFASPAAHKTSMIIVGLFVWSFFTIPFLPFSVTPMLPAYFIWVAAFAVWSYLANLQKRI